MQKKVSAIICAYNEAPRIGAVLTALIGHPLLAEILVIDDGSSDGTKESAESYLGVRVIRHEKNRGKTAALVTGITESLGDTLLFMDADLQGVTPENVTALLEPVLSGRTDITLNMRENALALWHFFGIDLLTGERVMPKTFLQRHINELEKLPRFGFETYIGRAAAKEKLSVQVVDWPNVRLISKPKKTGFLRGYKAQLRMFGDVMTALSLGETAAFYVNYFLFPAPGQTIQKLSRHRKQAFIQPLS